MCLLSDYVHKVQLKTGVGRCSCHHICTLKRCTHLPLKTQPSRVFGSKSYWDTQLLDLSIIHPAGDVIQNITKTTQHYIHSSIVVVKGAIPY